MSTELFQFQHKYFQMRSPRNGRRETFFLSLSDCLHNIPNVCIFSWLAIHIRYYFVHMLTSFGWMLVLFVCLVHETIQLRSHNFIRTKLHWNFLRTKICAQAHAVREREWRRDHCQQQLLFMKIENIWRIFPSFCKH